MQPPLGGIPKKDALFPLARPWHLCREALGFGPKIQLENPKSVPPLLGWKDRAPTFSKPSEWEVKSLSPTT